MNYCIRCMSEIEEGATSCPHCGLTEAIVAPEHHLVPGTMLKDRYFIGAALGEGGFGITYIGRDIMLDIKVAIKEYFPNGFVVRNSIYSQEVSCSQSGSRKEMYDKGKEKFLTEARTLAKFIQEPGIVTVRDFFEWNNTAYIVMEYIEGKTLKNFINEKGSLSAEETVRMMMPVMESLGKVHATGLIHRDISPDNIMLENGKAKLLDFGAARDYGDGNKSFSIVLKRGYAPEEQYRSKGVQGPWTDIYAMAATMYRCITGTIPDESTERVVSDSMKAPSEMGLKIDKRFEKAIMKALSVHQNDRYQTMEAFMEALNKGFEAGAKKPKEKPVKEKAVKEKPVKEKKVKEKPSKDTTDNKPTKKKFIIGIVTGFVVLSAIIGIAIGAGSQKAGNNTDYKGIQNQTNNTANNNEKVNAADKLIQQNGSAAMNAEEKRADNIKDYLYDALQQAKTRDTYYCFSETDYPCDEEGNYIYGPYVRGDLPYKPGCMPEKPSIPSGMEPKNVDFEFEIFYPSTGAYVEGFGYTDQNVMEHSIKMACELADIYESNYKPYLVSGTEYHFKFQVAVIFMSETKVTVQYTYNAGLTRTGVTDWQTVRTEVVTYNLEQGGKAINTKAYYYIDEYFARTLVARINEKYGVNIEELIGIYNPGTEPYDEIIKNAVIFRTFDGLQSCYCLRDMVFCVNVDDFARPYNSDSDPFRYW